MSDFDRSKVISLLQAADAGQGNVDSRAVQALATYLHRHNKRLPDLFESDIHGGFKVVDYGLVEKAEELARENRNLLQRLDTEPDSFRQRIQALEDRLAKRERDYTALENNFNKLNSRSLELLTQNENLKNVTKENRRIPIHRAKWVSVGVLTTLFLGAVISKSWDTSMYDEIRIRSVGPLSSVFAGEARSISRWLPSVLWYNQYAVVNTEFANARMVETTASPIVEKFSQGSCVMMTGRSDLDPAWIKFEQRVDGKTITGYMHSDNLEIEEAYIGKPCVAYSYGG